MITLSYVIKKTHFMFNNFFSENWAVYGIMWKNTAELAGRRWQCD